MPERFWPPGAERAPAEQLLGLNISTLSDDAAPETLALMRLINQGSTCHPGKSSRGMGHAHWPQARGYMCELQSGRQHARIWQC